MQKSCITTLILALLLLVSVLLFLVSLQVQLIVNGNLKIGLHLVFGTSYSIYDFIMAIATSFGTIALIFYTFSTHKIRNTSERQQGYEVFMGLVGVLSSKENYYLRKALHEKVAEKLKHAILFVFGSTSALDGIYSHSIKSFFDPDNKETNCLLEKLRKELSEKDRTSKDSLRDRFRAKLNEEVNITSKEKMSCLTVIELILLSFDYLSALSHYEKKELKPLNNFIEQWKPVLKSTSKILLPYVRIEGALRIEYDKSYKYHYQKLLKDVGVCDKEFELPEKPKEMGKTE